MNMKKLKYYLPFYLGCEVKETSNGKVSRRTKILTAEMLRYFLTVEENIIPLLRPISDLKPEDFYSFGLAGKGQILINATVNGMWCSGLYEVKEYDEIIEDELSVDPKDLLYQLEESDFDNVLSCTKTGQIAYGTSDEMRYFVELETLSKWVNHLRERRIDVDGLIKAGLAIDATTYADKRSVATTDSQRSPTRNQKNKSK